MNTKSKTCVGNMTGQPLTEYHTAMEARQEAAWVSQANDRAMRAYECRVCGKWHLSPTDRHTPSVYCSDCGKDLYANERDARRRADILRAEQGVQLSLYRCGSGWHLTKRKPGIKGRRRQFRKKQ